MTTLVTGANGFVGRAVCEELSRHTTVRAAVRTADPSIAAAEVVTIGPIDAGTDWRRALEGVDAVVHLASRVHMLQESSDAAYAQYHATNVEGTAALARAAAAAGVRSFVFVSTVKVHGEESFAQPFAESDEPRPQDGYGRSKLEAERALEAIARESAMRVTIIRPPLVYGPRVRANFLRLLSLVERGLPLPLGSIQNRRSMIYMRNLADAIRVASQHPEHAGTYLVSDGEDLSTPELIRRLATHMGRPARLLPIPAALLTLGAHLLGKGGAVRRVTSSLQVDSRAFRERFGWTPPVPVDTALAETVTWYRQRERR